jgi:biopolymer transport protein TolR
MRRKSKFNRRSIAEINVVPYIDVMLVLLVIFMATTPLITQGVEVDLPVASAKALSSDTPMPVVVSINSQGEVFLNIAATPKKPITADIVQAEVAAALSLNPKRQVLVRADKDVSYSLVMQTMVLLQASGVPSVGLETSDMVTDNG